MDRTLTTTEARAALRAVLDRVEAGDEVTITRRGRPIAVVVQPGSLRSRRAASALATAGELESKLIKARSPLAATPACRSDMQKSWRLTYVELALVIGGGTRRSP